MLAIPSGRQPDDAAWLEPVPEADLTTARLIVEATLQPAAKPALIRELLRLRALVKTRRDDNTDLDLSIEALAEELRRHPGDIAIWAIRQWPRRSKFWPALAELEEVIAIAAAPRLLMLRAIDQYDDPTWPRWITEIWGPAPEGPRKRAEFVAARTAGRPR